MSVYKDTIIAGAPRRSRSSARHDIGQATALARAMVARWEMSKEIGPVDLRESEERSSEVIRRSRWPLERLISRLEREERS